MAFSRRDILMTALSASFALPMVARGQAAKEAALSGQKPSSIVFSQWEDTDPPYLFFPGDELETQIVSAPELNRKQTVGPDGRINLPYVGQIMAAYRSIDELQAVLSDAYARVLVRPDVQVFRGATAPLRVLVGGAVNTPGWVDMGGADLDILSAVFAAGGPTVQAKPEIAVLIRRAKDGTAMRKIIDLKAMIDGRETRLEALRRFDIVYMPRKKIAEANIFVDQWINGLIPGAVLNYFTYRTFS